MGQSQSHPQLPNLKSSEHRNPITTPSSPSLLPTPTSSSSSSSPAPHSFFRRRQSSSGDHQHQHHQSRPSSRFLRFPSLLNRHRRRTPHSHLSSQLSHPSSLPPSFSTSTSHSFTSSATTPPATGLSFASSPNPLSHDADDTLHDSAAIPSSQLESDHKLIQSAPVVPLIEFQQHLPVPPSPSSAHHIHPAHSFTSFQPPPSPTPIEPPSLLHQPHLGLPLSLSPSPLPTPENVNPSSYPTFNQDYPGSTSELPMPHFPTSLSPSPSPSPEPTLSLDLSPEALSPLRPTEESETSNSVPLAPRSPTSGTQPPTRRIYVQGMVVARNVAHESNRPPSSTSQLRTQSSSQSLPADAIESRPHSPTEPVSAPANVLLEQASMISRLLSVAAAAAAASLLPSALNADGTAIPTPQPPTPPNSDALEPDHGGLQQTLRDALRAAFGGALVNPDQGPTSAPSSPLPHAPQSSSPLPQLPVSTDSSNEEDDNPPTPPAGPPSTLIHSLGLDQLINPTNPTNSTSNDPATLLIASNPLLNDVTLQTSQQSFQAFLSELQADVGQAIVDTLSHTASDQAFNFFRMHRFDPSEPDALVPVLLVGVRSAPSAPSAPTHVTDPPFRTAPDIILAEQAALEPSIPIVSESVDGFETDGSAQEVEQQTSEILRPDPQQPGSEPEFWLEEPEARPDQRSWLIFVLAGLYPANHPIFTAPGLFIPHHPSLDYETMIRLAELIGPHKPQTATALQIERAGLRTFDLRQARDEGLVAEKCLICLEEYTDDDEEIRLLKCSHLFHKDCIDQWLTSGSATCPACRDLAV